MNKYCNGIKSKYSLAHDNVRVGRPAIDLDMIVNLDRESLQSWAKDEQGNK